MFVRQGEFKGEMLLTRLQVATFKTASAVDLHTSRNIVWRVSKQFNDVMVAGSSRVRYLGMLLNRNMRIMENIRKTYV